MKKYLLLLGLMATQFPAMASGPKHEWPHVNYINLPVQIKVGKDAGTTVNIGGQLRVPQGAEAPAPAVIILHSTGGIDSTGNYYARRLNRQGIATLELDMWGGRGLSGGANGRPASPHETLADAYTALAYLAQRPDIDATRIGLMGFSWGGVVSMLTATQQYDQIANLPFKFAGHVAHYPLCYGYNVVPGFEFGNLTGAPVLIQSAELDQYEYPGACDSLKANLSEEDQQHVEVVEHQGVHHTWDRLEREKTIFDPFAHAGQGGEVLLKADRNAARKSRRNVVRFFRDIFGL